MIRKKILIEITSNDNYKVEVETKLSQKWSDVNTRPLGLGRHGEEIIDIYKQGITKTIKLFQTEAFEISLFLSKPH